MEKFRSKSVPEGGSLHSWRGFGVILGLGFDFVPFFRLYTGLVNPSVFGVR